MQLFLILRMRALKDLGQKLHPTQPPHKEHEEPHPLGRWVKRDHGHTECYTKDGGAKKSVTPKRVIQEGASTEKGQPKERRAKREHSKEVRLLHATSTSSSTRRAFPLPNYTPQYQDYGNYHDSSYGGESSQSLDQCTPIGERPSGYSYQQQHSVYLYFSPP